MIIVDFIKKCHSEILCRQNMRWIAEHKRELSRKYNGWFVLVANKQVVCSSQFLTSALCSDKPGAIIYQTMIDPIQYFGDRIKDMEL